MSKVYDLHKKLDFELQACSKKIYEKAIKNILFSSQLTSDDKLSMLKSIFTIQNQKVIIPDKCFTEWGVFGTNLSVDIYTFLLSEKKSLDNYVNDVMEQCKRVCRIKIDGERVITFEKLENLLELNNYNQAYKIFIYQLLYPNYLEKTLTAPLNDLYRQEFPLRNIYVNNITQEYLIDTFMCKTSYYAKAKNLRLFVQAMKECNLDYKFKPLENEKHANILEWLQYNIHRGEEAEANGTSIILGWKEGADSGWWPSTHLNDYQETLTQIENL